MKLLIVFPSTIRGGAEEYALTIADAAVTDGWIVHAAFPDTEGTQSLQQDCVLRQIVYHSLNIEEQSEYHAETLLRHLIRLIRTGLLLRRVQPDVVLLSLPWPIWGLGSLIACGILNIPTVLVFHLVSPSLVIGPRRLKIYHWLKSLRQHWITVSEFNRQIISASFQMSLSEIACIYNGIPLSDFLLPDGAYQRQRDEIRRQLGIAAETKLIVTVGRLHQQKGYDDLIPAIPHILKEFPDTIFLWVGDGPQRDHLQQRLEEYGVASHVTLTGYRQDVSALLHAADLFVFPTHFEGLPFAVLEAMACGAPIVSSRAASLPEIIEHGTHGLLFCTGDSCDLLETLRWTLRHPEQMQTMAQNALLRVQDFDQQRMIAQTLAVLHDLAHSKNEC